jgi:CheY-like chemotaxis protein
MASQDSGQPSKAATSAHAAAHTAPKTMRICFVLSSIGGPRMLSPLFSGPIRDDVAYVVIQRMAGAGLLDVLVECLREEVKSKTLVAGHTLQLRPGCIHFLPNERNYVFEGDKLIAADVPGKARLSLDLLFSAAASLPNPCVVVVLSGMLTDEDGLAGLAKLSAKGVPILGSLESNTPVFDMIEQIRAKGLMGELYPPKYLLEHLRFNGSAKPGSPNRSGGDGVRILVADDEEKVRGMVGDMLSLQGYSPDFAGDGLDALRKIQKGQVRRAHPGSEHAGDGRPAHPGGAQDHRPHLAHRGGDGHGRSRQAPGGQGIQRPRSASEALYLGQA